MSKKNNDDLFDDDTISGFFGKSNSPHEIMVKIRETKAKIKKKSLLKNLSSKIKALIILLIIVLFFVTIYIFANLWASILWYKQLGYLQVPIIKYSSIALMFLVGFIITFLILFFSIKKSLKAEKDYVPQTSFGLWFKRGKLLFEPLKKPLTYIIPIVFAIIIGVSFSNTWSNFLLMTHSKSFGKIDPIFHKDAGFYVFKLPEILSIAQIITVVFTISFVIVLIILLMYGGIKIQKNKPRVILSKKAFPVIGTLGFFEFLSLALLLYLLRFAYITVQNKKTDGATFAQIHANMPSLMICSIVSILISVLFLIFIFVKVNSFTKKMSVVLIIFVCLAFIIEGIYPLAVQELYVAPNQQVKEKQYIQNNIDATLYAYGLDNIKTIKQKDIKSNDLSKIRLVDPALISPTFTQLEQGKQYYNFSPTLWPDHYKFDNDNQDVVLGVRELNPKGLSQNNWINAHTVYTHGFGVVASYGTTVDSDGKPKFIEKNIPPTGKFGKYEPRIYFGYSSPNYSIVGGKNSNYELDYPSDNDSEGQKNYSYNANGGPKVNNFLNKIAFSIKFKDPTMLFSSRVTNDSQILFNRNPIQRVKSIAPYLTIDERPYPVIAGGNMYYVIDGYTITNSFPYSQHINLKKATTDSLTATPKTGISSLKSNKVNYINNSVKAIMNAYTGEVKLYSMNNNDPILQSWASIYNNTLHPISEIGNDLSMHFKYPQSLFKVQRQMYSTYHINKANSYYSGQNFWQIPNDPIQKTKNNIPVQLLYLQDPEIGKNIDFSGYTPYIPYGSGNANTNRNILTGYLIAPSYDSKRQLTLIQMPQQTSLPGPGQIQNIFNSDPKVAPVLRLLKDGGSQIIYGNLLTIPYKQSFLYIEPVYVQSSYGTKFPTLKKILTYYNGRVGFSDSLDLSLNQVLK